jgi:hypothetical protein
MLLPLLMVLLRCLTPACLRAVCYWCWEWLCSDVDAIGRTLAWTSLLSAISKQLMCLPALPADLSSLSAVAPPRNGFSRMFDVLSAEKPAEQRAADIAAAQKALADQVMVQFMQVGCFHSVFVAVHAGKYLYLALCHYKLW